MKHSEYPCQIVVGARDSQLSKAQVEEVLNEVRQFHPEITFETIFIKSHGDFDKKTSLRMLDKTDFFTREIDEMVLSGRCRIAIHSAKDLPEPIPKGLEVVALTKGVDPSDVLVMRDGEELREGMVIATSSQRREESVQQRYQHVTFVDIRGTIEERLEKLFAREVDGVVIAEAALIRLGLTHLNRKILPGETAPLQGRLAIVACTDDEEIKRLFAPLQFPVSAVARLF